MSMDLPKGSMGEDPIAMPMPSPMLRAAWLPAMGQLGPPHASPLFWAMARCLVACSASSSFLSWMAMALLASGLAIDRLVLGMSMASLSATAACNRCT
jgi:hypothetical protein